MKRIIQIVVVEDEDRKLAEMAGFEGRSMSNLGRLLINEAYKKYEGHKVIVESMIAEDNKREAA
jgi:hypothetical protein